MNKQRKNVVLQRIDFIIQQKKDLYQVLINQDLKIDIKQALKMSIIEDEDKDNANADSFRRNDIKVYKYKNQSKQVMELINNYLKEAYQQECHSTIVRKRLKPFIKQGRLCELNINWVVLELSGGRTARQQNQGVYKKLLQSRHLYPDEHFESIQLDVVRTLQGERNQERLQKEKDIENVLTAYAIRNPIVGYCQGQNFIVNFLLNTLKYQAEDAFWVYCSLMETIMPLDYYTNIVSALADQKILEFYLEQYLPKLNHHFQKIGLQVDYFSLQWYLCLFTNQVNPKVIVNIIKLSTEVFLMLLLDGIKALIISSLILLILLQKELLKFKQFPDAIQYIHYYAGQYCDIDAFRHFYNRIKLQKKAFYFAREEIRDQLMKQHQSTLTPKQQVEVDKLLQCTPNQPICNKVQLMNSFTRRSQSFFTYRLPDPPNVINDYWDKFRQQEELFQEPEMLVTLQSHICIINKD